MGKRDEHAAAVRGIDPVRLPAYLTQRSGLPGPRANLELIAAVADVGDLALFDRLIDTDDEYLVCCGVVGLGAVLAAGPDPAIEARLRRHATDERWRVREAVAMALQRVGDADPDRLAELARELTRDDSPLAWRAAAAGICEPRLLREPSMAAAAIDVCRRCTDALVGLPARRRRDDDTRALRQALGYCWSVAVAADPAAGLGSFLALSESGDADVAWIRRENIRKKRLARLLPAT